MSPQPMLPRVLALSILVFGNHLCTVSAASVTLQGHSSSSCNTNDDRFIDDRGNPCSWWTSSSRVCSTASITMGFSAFSQQMLQCHCPAACGYTECNSNKCIASCTYDNSNYPNSCATKRTRYSACNFHSQCHTGFCCPNLRVCLASSTDPLQYGVMPPFMLSTGIDRLIGNGAGGISNKRACDPDSEIVAWGGDPGSIELSNIDGRTLVGCKTSYIWMMLLNEWASCPAMTSSCTFKGDGARPTSEITGTLSFEFSLSGAYDPSADTVMKNAFKKAIAGSFSFLSESDVTLTAFGRAANLPAPPVVYPTCDWTGTPGMQTCSSPLTAGRQPSQYENCMTFNGSEQNGLLCDFNRARAEHGSPPLVWDDDLAKVAQNYAVDAVYDTYNSQAGTRYQSLGGATNDVGEIYSTGLWGNNDTRFGLNCPANEYGHVETSCASDNQKCGSTCVEIPKVGPQFEMWWKGRGAGTEPDAWKTCGTEMAFNMSCVPHVTFASDRACPSAMNPCLHDEVPFNACPAEVANWPCPDGGNWCCNSANGQCSGSPTLSQCHSGRCKTHIHPSVRPADKVGPVGSAENKCCYDCYDYDRPGYRIDLPHHSNNKRYDQWVQILWKNAQKVGCGYHRKPRTYGADQGLYLWCNFWPAATVANGNFKGANPNLAAAYGPDTYAANIGMPNEKKRFAPCTWEARYRIRVPTDISDYVKKQIDDTCSGVVCSPFQGNLGNFSMRSSGGDFKYGLAAELATIMGDSSTTSSLRRAADANSKTVEEVRLSIVNNSVMGPEIQCRQSTCAKSQGCRNYAGEQSFIPSECERRKSFPDIYTGSQQCDTPVNTVISIDSPTTTTTTTNAPGASAVTFTTTTMLERKVTGSLTLSVSNATAFQNDTTVVTALKTGIASAINGVSANEVTILSVTASRRLTGIARILTAGGVVVNYEINLPASVSTPAANVMEAAADSVKTSINSELASAGTSYSVSSLTATSVSVETTVISAGTGASSGVVGTAAAAYPGTLSAFMWLLHATICTVLTLAASDRAA